MNDARERANDLLDFVNRCPTARHAAAEIARRLLAAEFKELDERDRWRLDEGPTGYFVRRPGAALAAFALGETRQPSDGFAIAAAHLDSPGLKLKLQSARREATGGGVAMNVELYGSPIVSTWLDRPLAVAGAVCLDLAGRLEMRTVASESAVAVIPNPAIHLNREMNKGFEYNPQDHLRPIFGSGDTTPDALRDALAQRLAVEPTAIRAAELSLVPPAGTLAGVDSSLIVSPRLDDLAMCEAILAAFLAGTPRKKATMAVFFDHEEVGSRTANGADSSFLRSLFTRIACACGGDDVDACRMAVNSFLVSADMAHALHPNFADRHDPAYAPVVNGGLAIKTHAGMKYATTPETAARFHAICRQADVPVQYFTPKSDQPTGSTVGPFLASQLGVPTVDVGAPLWAMHSCFETGGVRDLHVATRAFAEFFSDYRSASRESKFRS